jgi:succinate dehydrogenase / fumarate reductase cytochrome b subunit
VEIKDMAIKDTYQPRSAVRPKNPLRAWFDVRGRSFSSIAFALNRLTGIGLTVYLYLHLIVLSLLLRGDEGWNQFLAIARTPLFLALDMVLIFGILFHGLNGIRVGLVGTGVATHRQRDLFIGLMIVAAILFLVSGWLVFTK